MRCDRGNSILRLCLFDASTGAANQRSSGQPHRSIASSTLRGPLSSCWRCDQWKARVVSCVFLASPRKCRRANGGRRSVLCNASSQLILTQFTIGVETNQGNNNTEHIVAYGLRTAYNRHGEAIEEVLFRRQGVRQSSRLPAVAC